MQDPLKLGFFIQPVHPPFRCYADVLREDREAVVLADRLGYREAFIGEHLVDAAETITSSLAFIASLADACPSITFGTGVLPLANYHPAMAAAQVAMVDHLVHGRLVLGVGPGVSGDAEAIGDLGSDRNRKTQEALDHMCRIWSEEPPYRIEGEFYRTTTERSLDRNIGVGVAVRPLQRPHPPIAITSIRPDSRGPHAAGARGWTGISATYVGERADADAQPRTTIVGTLSATIVSLPEGRAHTFENAGLSLEQMERSPRRYVASCRSRRSLEVRGPAYLAYCHPHPRGQHRGGGPSCSVARAWRPSCHCGISRLRNGRKLASGPTRESSVCAWRNGSLRWPAMSAGRARSRTSKYSVIQATGGAVWLLSRSRPRSARLWSTTCCPSIGREMAMRRVSRWPSESGSSSMGGWLRFSSACLATQWSEPGLTMLVPALTAGARRRGDRAAAQSHPHRWRVR